MSTLVKITCPSCGEAVDLRTDCDLPSDQLTAARREIERLRMALKEIGDWCDGQNLYVTRIARDALNAPTTAKPC